jgi:hypothetical protein
LSAGRVYHSLNETTAYARMARKGGRSVHHAFVRGGGALFEWAFMQASILASTRKMGEGGYSYILKHNFVLGINILRFCKIKKHLNEKHNYL